MIWNVSHFDLQSMAVFQAVFGLCDATTDAAWNTSTPLSTPRTQVSRACWCKSTCWPGCYITSVTVWKCHQQKHVILKSDAWISKLEHNTCAPLRPFVTSTWRTSNWEDACAILKTYAAMRWLWAKNNEGGKKKVQCFTTFILQTKI